MDNSRVMLQIVSPLTDDSSWVINDCNMSLIHGTGQEPTISDIQEQQIWT